jgi:ATP-binding cassette subfamily F protein 2
MAPKNPRLEKKKRDKAKKETNAAEAGGASTDSLTALLNEDGSEMSGEDKLRARGIIVTYEAQARKQHAHDRDINVSQLTMTYHGSPLIEESDLSLNYGNRYGFIGRNGCGKSTFMEALGARCVPIPEGIDLYYVKEEIEASEITALAAVMSVEKEREKLEKEAELLNEKILDEDGNDDLHDRIAQVYERLDQMDAATAETRASTILSGLGFTPAKQQAPTSSFSGGWRMRIALARALFIQPTLLLLDEPTNHLDMEAVVWLEDYLSKWDKILFLVSHSQDFMNSVVRVLLYYCSSFLFLFLISLFSLSRYINACLHSPSHDMSLTIIPPQFQTQTQILNRQCTHIVHLSQKKIEYFSGNYDSFVNTLSDKNEEQEKRYKAEQDQIAHMKEYVARFGQGNAKMAKQAQSKEKTLEKMMRGGLTDKVYKEKALDFRFNDCGKLSPPVLQCTDISFGYPGCEILYSGVDFGVDLDSRVALVGPNGAGKSTLLKIMTGELMPVHGDVRPHSHLRISKFTQHFVDVLDLDLCPLDYMLKLWPSMTREEGRKFLGRYGISGVVQTQEMSQLSDGQKSRVVLAKIAKENPHVLFLDEPTNHLDMESIDSLAKAINQFDGGLVLVSHDMRLISQVAKEIWMVSDKTIRKFTGEINDFKMYVFCYTIVLPSFLPFLFSDVSVSILSIYCCLLALSDTT